MFCFRKIAAYRHRTPLKPPESQESPEPPEAKIPRNIWGVSITSFLTDVSSEMVINLVPLFLSSTLGVKTSVIGLVEGIAESTSSLLKIVSGWISDRLARRKWLAVAGYAISTAAKPLFALAGSWGTVAAVRWTDRVGKGVRTAPRDALVADSVKKEKRGFAFGFHRAADTLGAVMGLAIAMLVVQQTQTGEAALDRATFQTVALISAVPALLGVIVLAVVTHEAPGNGQVSRKQFRSRHTDRTDSKSQEKSSENTDQTQQDARTARPGIRQLGRPFLVFLLIMGLFDLGNSSDAFLVLRSKERGASVSEILGMLLVFNLVYALVSIPAGSLSDRIGRRKVLVAGWTFYGIVYLGFALAETLWQTWTLFAAYGAYYGLSQGTAKAFVADLVPAQARGTAYGAYNTALGIIDFPASLLAGLLWEGIGSWQGFGPSAPFYAGAILALSAAAAMWIWQYKPAPPTGTSTTTI